MVFIDCFGFKHDVKILVSLLFIVFFPPFLLEQFEVKLLEIPILKNFNWLKVIEVISLVL